MAAGSDSLEPKQSGTGLFTAGLLVAAAGLILLLVRLLLGMSSTLGILSNALITISGVIIAWRPLWNRIRTPR